ncbi:hypothetical protein OEB99_12955 [Actinotalea sp. M2MS4P-6]|uniref:hypothetical protein n=1 Tax=Actinotalea sp. M2MS4P-6 TaxID=2983762 RepID=UPI0021E3B641|nr:hypothetical protein [Actinotalea sp. M2MS4P-6]MCV2395220.1 hypothetical protein [Actinotalea sp. M2MS4P-6]
MTETDPWSSGPVGPGPAAPVPRHSAFAPERPAAADPSVSSGSDETTIVCPECGTPTVVDLSRRDSDDFCPRCDYPLFWARPRDRSEAPPEDTDGYLRRAPGASGNTLTATMPCPECGELNDPTADVCVRCGADMNPAPPPEPEPLPVPEPAVIVLPEPIREADPPQPFPWWWFAAMAALAATAWLIGALW